MMIIPPMNSINDMLRVRAKVAIKLIMEFSGCRCSKCSHVVENVIAF